MPRQAKIMFPASRQRTHQRAAIANGIKSITANLLKASLLIVLLTSGFNQLIGRHANTNLVQQVAAAKLKGVIYNKDGKFIYRPSRASQAHIIIIDDRKQENQRVQPSDDWSGASNRSDHHAVSDAFASQNPLIQLLAPSLPRHPSQLLSHPIARIATNTGHIKALYAPPFQLINLNDFQTGPSSSQINGRNSALMSANSLPPASLLPGQTPSTAGYQMLPIIQMIPPSQNSRAATSMGVQPPFDGYNNYNNPFGIPTQQAQPSLEMSAGDLAAAGDPFQQQRPISGYDSLTQASHPYYQPPSRKRSFYEGVSQNSFNGGFTSGSNPSQMNLYEQQPQFLSPYLRSDTPSVADLVPPFDEPPHQPIVTARNSPMGGYQANQPPSMGLEPTTKTRRLSSSSFSAPGPVQDLDDVEGDHVEYYDADSRDRSRGSIGSHERNSNRHYMRPPSHHSQVSSMDDGMGVDPHVGSHRSSNGNGSGGSLGHHNHTQHIPGSIQSIKSQLKKSNLSSPKMKPRKSSVPPRDDDQAGLDHSGSQAREPKSLQYWKQYQDQFDIMRA